MSYDYSLPKIIDFDQLIINLESERKNLEEDLNDYELWPVISTGIVYQF